MSALAANLAIAVGILVTVIGLLLSAVGFMAYRRIGQGRMLWIAAAFLGFAAQGLMMSMDAWQDRDAGWPIGGLLSLAILIALYLAVLKR